MALADINLDRLKQTLNPNLTPDERARALDMAFAWSTISASGLNFVQIYTRLEDGTETDSDKRVLMALYVLACAAQDRIDTFARRCAMCCCTWIETANGDFMRRINGGMSLDPALLNEGYEALLESVSAISDPVPLTFTRDLQAEFGGPRASQPQPETPKPSVCEPHVQDVAHCCAAQIIHKWGCGDPDGYDIHMGVSDVEELFKRGWFNRLKPVQLAILQEYQIEEGLGEVLKANGWECLRDEVKNNKGQRTLSIWAYFRDVPCYDDDDEYDEDF